MSRKETAPTFSVVNGKLMRATSTARIEVRPTEAAATLNELLTVLIRAESWARDGLLIGETLRADMRAAIAKATAP